jgi:L-ascorbate metabolism protein UlaG (beta-lactamase superfamily)
LFPKESIQAAIEGKAQKVMPVHWGGFALSYQHTWTEPAEDFVAACLDENLEFGLPKIGEIFTVDSVSAEKWWLSL